MKGRTDREIPWFVTGVFGLPWLLLAAVRVRSPHGGLAALLTWLLPTVWSPTVIAMLLIWSRKGPPGIVDELRTRLTLAGPLSGWLLIAVCVPVAFVGTAIMMARAAGDAAPFVRLNALPQAIALQVITGALGEELGWRGYLLPRLQRVLGPVGGAWCMGFLWSLWHVPAFFFPGLPHQHMPATLNLLFTATFGVFLAWLFSRTRSVLPTMLGHLSLNASMALGGVEFSSVAYWSALAIAFGTLAVGVSSVERRGLRPVLEPS